MLIETRLTVALGASSWMFGLLLDMMLRLMRAILEARWRIATIANGSEGSLGPGSIDVASARTFENGR